MGRNKITYFRCLETVLRLIEVYHVKLPTYVHRCTGDAEYVVAGSLAIEVSCPNKCDGDHSGEKKRISRMCDPSRTAVDLMPAWTSC